MIKNLMGVKLFISLILLKPSWANPVNLQDDKHWTNGNFEIARSKFSVGEPLILLAKVISEDGIWGSCVWTSPNKETWCADEEITDANGDIMEGVEVYNL